MPYSRQSRTPTNAGAQLLEWVTLSTVGLSLGAILLMVSNRIILAYEDATPIPKAAMYMLEMTRAFTFVLPGLSLAISQWLFLRPLKRLHLWILATTVTFPLVLPAILGAAFAAEEPGPPFQQSVGLLSGTAIFCTPMAVAQWLLLRTHFQSAALWLPGSYFGWLLALGFLVYGGTAVIPNSAYGLPVLAAALAALQGVATGLVLLSFKLKPAAPLTGA
jgi:hypothetical protein